MAFRRAVIASVLALATVSLGSTAQAGSSCMVTAMGLTFDNCVSETPFGLANAAEQTRARTAAAARAEVSTTGAIVRRPANR